MAITLGTPVTGTAGLVTTVSTASITVASGDVLVAVYASSATSDTGSTCVFNSGAQSLTQLNFRSSGSGATQSRLEVWAIDAPSAGSGTVTFTAAASAGFKAAAAFVVQGAASGAGWADASVKIGSVDTTPTLTITSETGDLAFAALVWRDTGSGTFTADASPVAQIGSINSGTGGSHVALRLLSETGAASTSPSGTLSVSKTWGMIGFNINAAGAASGRGIRMDRRRRFLAAYLGD